MSNKAEKDGLKDFSEKWVSRCFVSEGQFEQYCLTPRIRGSCIAQGETHGGVPIGKRFSSLDFLSFFLVSR